MNFLASCTPNDRSILEHHTGERRGYAQLYRWECASIGFKFEAWVSYEGDYSLAKQEMWRQFRAFCQEKGIR